MFLKYEQDGKYLYAHVEAEVFMESHNAIKLIVRQYLSNFIHDSAEGSMRLIVGRKLMAETEKISMFEFCGLVQKKLNEVKAKYEKGETIQCDGVVFPFTIIEQTFPELIP